nr:hypothetical protein [Pseudomonas kairouanensis]
MVIVAFADELNPSPTGEKVAALTCDTVPQHNMIKTVDTRAFEIFIVCLSLYRNA